MCVAVYINVDDVFSCANESGQLNVEAKAPCTFVEIRNAWWSMSSDQRKLKAVRQLCESLLSMSRMLAVRKETVSIQYTSMAGEQEAGGSFGDTQGPFVLFHYHIFLLFLHLFLCLHHRTLSMRMLRIQSRSQTMGDLWKHGLNWRPDQCHSQPVESCRLHYMFLGGETRASVLVLNFMHDTCRYLV